MQKMDRTLSTGVLGTNEQRPWGGNMLVHLECSKNNLEVSVAGAECAGAQGVEQDEVRGENGIRCWGSFTGH